MTSSIASVHTGYGKLYIGLTAKAEGGNSTIKITGARNLNLDLTNNQYRKLDAGEFQITEGKILKSFASTTPTWVNRSKQL